MRRQHERIARAERPPLQLALDEARPGGSLFDAQRAGQRVQVANSDGIAGAGHDEMQSWLACRNLRERAKQKVAALLRMKAPEKEEHPPRSQRRIGAKEPLPQACEVARRRGGAE